MGKQLELYDNFPIKVNVSTQNRNIILSDSKKEVKNGYALVCEVNATHAGTLINNRIYPPDAMKKGIRTWTSPYKKPVLTNHDDTKDPIGRVISARYEKTPKGMDREDYKPILRESEGYGFQRLTVKITDPEAIQKILDGRYETVSVRMSTDHCFCSICNTDWSDGEPCEHTPGSKYDGKLAYMTTGDLSYRELSFVNIPADEYAGVKEAIIAEHKDAAQVSVYANNDEEKVLADLGSGSNLYTLLDAEVESDDVVTYLLDKSNKTRKIDKEEDVKLSELTKEQVQDLEVVKALVQEAVDKARAEANKALEDAKKECKDSLDKLSAEIEDMKKKKKEEEGKEEDEDAKKKKKEEEEKEEEDAKKKKEKKEEEEEEEEEDKKKKKGSPTENKGSGKSGGVKHGAGNQSPVGEDPGDSLEQKVKELEDSNKKVLDENVKINAELHKMVAERLYDLKKMLRKPDVVSISTPDARDKKVEEFAQRSIDSLKDQIRDLQLEQENALATGFNGSGADSPAISPSDLTNEVMEDKKKVREGKQGTLSRLFPKSK
jgi:hypothetical protein